MFFNLIPSINLLPLCSSLGQKFKDRYCDCYINLSPSQSHSDSDRGHHGVKKAQCDSSVALLRCREIVNPLEVLGDTIANPPEALTDRIANPPEALDDIPNPPKALTDRIANPTEALGDIPNPPEALTDRIVNPPEALDDISNPPEVLTVRRHYSSGSMCGQEMFRQTLLVLCRYMLANTISLCMPPQRA